MHLFLLEFVKITVVSITVSDATFKSLTELIVVFANVKSSRLTFPAEFPLKSKLELEISV